MDSLNKFQPGYNIWLSKLKITFEATEKVELPQYKGATFRGSMGHAFRQLVCTFPGKKCEQCMRTESCLFAEMYCRQLPVKHPAFGKFTSPPRPYIINPMPSTETNFPAGNRFWFELILIGSIIKPLSTLLPLLFSRMGENGIGRGRGRFVPSSLEHADNMGNYSPMPAVGTPGILQLSALKPELSTETVSLFFETPVRFLSGRKPLTDAPSFDRLVSNLSLRLALLASVYCNEEFNAGPETDNPNESVRIEKHDLKWVNWQHYSGTKNLTMKFDGFTGEITYCGEIRKWDWLLSAGEIVHTGSTATFGLGK